MTTITNKYGFPEAVVRAVQNDPYQGGGDISVTQLINPPQQRLLRKQFKDQIEEDVSDMIWSLMGQSVHHILERGSQDGDIVEERVFAEIEGWEVSGQFDLLDKDLTLWDYKITSAWSIKDALENGKTEWDDQLNLLAALIRYNPDIPNPKKLAILAICRDWSQFQAMRDENYPPKAVVVPIEMLSEKAADSLLRAYVQDHQRGNRPCSAKERWEKPTTYAVMKEGRKSALRVLEDEGEALEWAHNKGVLNLESGEWRKGHYLEERPGESTRCERYCNVAQFCPQFKLIKLNQQLEEAEENGDEGKVYEIEQIIDGLTVQGL